MTPMELLRSDHEWTGDEKKMVADRVERLVCECYEHKRSNNNFSRLYKAMHAMNVGNTHE